MKKKLMALAAAATFVLAAGSAFASTDTPVASVGANEGGMVVYVDGHADNGPDGYSDGYIGVDADGQCIAASDDGGPDSDPDYAGPECLFP